MSQINCNPLPNPSAVHPNFKKCLLICPEKTPHLLYSLGTQHGVRGKGRDKGRSGEIKEGGERVEMGVRDKGREQRDKGGGAET